MRSIKTVEPSQTTPGLSHPDTWLDNYGDYLYRYALFRLNDPGAAEDVVQDTFLAAIKARANYIGNASERTWLVGILKHKIVDHVRKSQRERPAKRDLAEVTDLLEDAFDTRGRWKTDTSSWPDPDESLEQVQFWEIFSACIDELPPRLGQAYVLKEIDGMNSEQVCKKLEISTTNNLWVMLSRARMRLRNCLQHKWFDKAMGGVGNDLL